MNTVFLIRESINGENPATSLEIESTQDVVEAWKFAGNNRKGFSLVNVPN